jgi:hypothetical protein
MNFEEKLNILNDITIKHGSHAAMDNMMCAMEAVAWLADERWSDKPECACPIISAFVRRWNDGICNDETRTRLLRPLIPRLLNTRSTKAIERRRMWMAVDWSIRASTPAFLRLVPSLELHADMLASLPEIVSAETLRDARTLVQAARKDAASAYADADASAAAADAAYAASAYAYADADASAAAADAAYAASAYASASAYAAASAYADADADAAYAYASASASAYAAASAYADADADAAYASKQKRVAAVVTETQAGAQQLVIRMCEVKE